MRSGEFVKQAGTYEAFVPADLNELELDLRPFVKLLSEADRAVARLDLATEFLPNPELFVSMYVRKEAVLSAQIEGTQASMNDLLEHEAGARQQSKRDDVEEIANYIAALNYGIDKLDEFPSGNPGPSEGEMICARSKSSEAGVAAGYVDTRRRRTRANQPLFATGGVSGWELDQLPICVRLLRNIHARILEGVRGQNCDPGNLRDNQNWIGPAGCTVEEATYVPPPANLVEDLLSDLETFIHQDDQFPVLIRAALVHQQFESIHPFWDGNGRLGRLLVTLMLMEEDVLHSPTLYLSDFFKSHRQDYYDALQRVHEDDDLEGWIRFFLRGVRSVSRDGTDTARSILSLRDRVRESVSEFDSTGSAHILLDSLFERPVVTVRQAEDIIGKSYPVANRLVGQFEEQGLLTEVTGQSRNRRYHFRPYLDLFGDLEP